MRARVTHLSILCAALVVLPAAARAQSVAPTAAPTAPDRVVLRNGAVFAGTIVRMDPGFQVVMLLPTGEHQVIPWPAVRTATHLGETIPGFAAPATPPPPPPPSLPPPAPERFSWRYWADVPRAGPPGMSPGPGSPRIHVEADRPDLGLYAYLGETGNSHETIEEGLLMCRAPCDVVVQRANDHLFYFTAPGVTRSSRFQLSGSEVTARVNTGSSALRTTGVLVSVISGVASVIALGVTVGAATAKGGASRPAQAAHQGDVEKAAGITAGVSGGVFLLGLVLVGVSSTSYTLDRRGAPTGSLGTATSF